MGWYDAFSNIYDASLESCTPSTASSRPRRSRSQPGMSVLDLPCGTGQSFPAIAKGLRGSGTIIGGDLSAGMLRKAAARAGGALGRAARDHARST